MSIDQSIIQSISQIVIHTFFITEGEKIQYKQKKTNEGFIKYS